ncbi:MAG TPA: response regulator [Calidithermus sp.]|nr:response regulator [Calidithermus sp.]
MSERPTILAVDDDPGVRAVYRAILGADFEVVLAEDGAAALALCTSRRFDLVLLDLLMPGLDGLSVLERLRAADAAVRVLVVTGLDRAQAALAAIRLGALDVVLKPFDPDDLMTLVRAVLEAAGPESGEAPPRPPLPGVLLAGGERGWRAALAIVLRRWCRVETVPTLARALACVAGWRPDLVVADLRTLDAPPASTLAALRHRLPSTPLLAIADRPEGLAVGQPGAVTLVAPATDLGRLLEDVAALAGLGPRVRLGPPVVRLVAAVSTDYATARVDALADTVGLSASHLGRLFREQVGLTLRDYVMRVRIEVAKELLRETGDKTAAIAEAVGFSDESHLARTFRRHDGQPPSAYRRT